MSDDVMTQLILSHKKGAVQRRLYFCGYCEWFQNRSHYWDIDWIWAIWFPNKRIRRVTRWSVRRGIKWAFGLEIWWCAGTKSCPLLVLMSEWPTGLKRIIRELLITSSSHEMEICNNSLVSRDQEERAHASLELWSRANKWIWNISNRCEALIPFTFNWYWTFMTKVDV